MNPFLLHLPLLTDTFSYVPGPGDTKDDAKQDAHAKSRTTTQKSIIWLRNDLKQPDLGNECIFLHLATTTDAISYVPGPGAAEKCTLPNNRRNYLPDYITVWTRPGIIIVIPLITQTVLALRVPGGLSSDSMGDAPGEFQLRARTQTV